MIDPLRLRRSLALSDLGPECRRKKRLRPPLDDRAMLAGAFRCSRRGSVFEGVLERRRPKRMLISRGTSRIELNGALRVTGHYRVIAHDHDGRLLGPVMPLRPPIHEPADLCQEFIP